MRVLNLFGLRIRHDYHPDGTCGDLHVQPTAKTRRLMERHRLRLQSLPDGLSVAAASHGDGPLIAPPYDEVFEFELGLRDPAFAAFTDLRLHAGLSAPVYRNRPDGSAELQLGEGGQSLGEGVAPDVDCLVDELPELVLRERDEVGVLHPGACRGLQLPEDALVARKTVLRLEASRLCRRQDRQHAQ